MQRVGVVSVLYKPVGNLLSILEMLNMGFIDDINDILSHVPDDRKMLLLSATMPNEIAKIAKRYMHDPQEFVVGEKNTGSENVRHVHLAVIGHM